MKTFRVEFIGNFDEVSMCHYGASHDCDGCSYLDKWSESHGADWGYESFSECRYEPEDKEYISNQSACDRDTTFSINETEEQEIIKYLTTDPELLFDYLDSLSIISEAMKDNDNVYDFIVEYYEKKVKEGG